MMHYEYEPTPYLSSHPTRTECEAGYNDREVTEITEITEIVTPVPEVSSDVDPAEALQDIPEELLNSLPGRLTVPRAPACCQHKPFKKILIQGSCVIFFFTNKTCWVT